ncbi:MAG: DUF3592 domain-containing protein [Anaerolineaceae bacterium]|nr:DUF3592 domain-containing protein [Anaerolineae bacterium]MCB9460938.1 DUF3592 domain-containing protein [Anaerolineaceae bacterium]
MSETPIKLKNNPLEDDPYASLPSWVRLWAFKGKFGDSKWKWVLIVALLILMSIFAWASFSQYQMTVSNQNLLNTVGITTDGTVMQKYTESRRSTTSNTSSTTYYVRYRFDANPELGLDLISAEQEVSRDFFNTVRENRDVTVTYLQDNPEVSRIEVLNDEGFILVATALSLLIFGVALFMAAANFQMDRFKASQKDKLF